MSDQAFLDDLVATYLVPVPRTFAVDQSSNPNLAFKTSGDGRALIEAFEGCDRPIVNRPGFFTTYYDEVGVLTLGFGHTNLGNIAPRIVQGSVWSQQQCADALSNDLARFEKDVALLFPKTILTQHQFDALVSLDFNTGSLARSSIPGKIIAGNLNAATATLLQYNHAGGQVLAGLTRRRMAEKLLFEGNVAAALTLAGAHHDTGKPMSKATCAPGGETPT